MCHEEHTEKDANENRRKQAVTHQNENTSRGPLLAWRSRRDRPKKPHFITSIFLAGGRPGPSAANQPILTGSSSLEFSAVTFCGVSASTAGTEVGAATGSSLAIWDSWVTFFAVSAAVPHISLHRNWRGSEPETSTPQPVQTDFPHSHQLPKPTKFAWSVVPQPSQKSGGASCTSGWLLLVLLEEDTCSGLPLSRNVLLLPNTQTRREGGYLSGVLLDRTECEWGWLWSECLATSMFL